jgi:hypothetical protein
LAGSKHSQYLKIQPREYVGFPFAGWWKEGEGKEKGEIHSPLHPCMRASCAGWWGGRER